MRIKIYSTVTTNSAQNWFLTGTAVECQLCRGTRCIYYQLPPWKTAGTRQYHDSGIDTQLPNLLYVSDNKTYSKGIKLLFMLSSPRLEARAAINETYFFMYLPVCSNLSGDIQQQCWRGMVATCRGYVQRCTAYESIIKSDCLWPLGFSLSTS